MPNDRTDPTGEVPEADLIEQQTALDPPGLIGEPGAAITPDQPGTAASLADEADLLEQAVQLPSDEEDDYPHGPPPGGRT